MAFEAPRSVVCYLVPSQMNAIPARRRARSSTLALMFLSLNRITPQMNEMITELRRTSDTTEIMESGSFSDVKYAKSARHMNIDISGMARLQWNGVVWWRLGYHISAHTTAIMII